MNTQRLLVYPALALALLLGACASADKSANARPVLYPNAKFQSMGDAAAQNAINTCIAAAQRQGLSASNNALSEKVGKGAATTGVMAAVGALVTGRSGETAVRHGSKAAVVGAAGGAVSGAYENQGNPMYRRYVETCLSERGLSVMGWQ